MKKVMAILAFISAIGLENAVAQEKTRPMDSTMLRDNMRTKMEDAPAPPMDIAPARKDNTRMDNMPIKRDTTPMEMDRMPFRRDTSQMEMDNIRRDKMRLDDMKRDKMPLKMDTAYNRKMNQTVNRMNRDSTPKGRYFWETRQDTALKGIYNGQRIRSDTIRNGAYYDGMRLENKPKGKLKSKNKAELDGTQNGKYNYETSQDSMPNAKNIDPYRIRYGSKYGDKMARNSTAIDTDKMRSEMNKENRGVLLQDGKAMIVRNGRKTVIKAFTYLSFGTKVMSDGTIVKQNGTKTMLKEGEFVNMLGEIVVMKN